MNYKPMKEIEYLVVHCAATPSTMDIGVKEITKWHIERGFFTIGYHFVIRRDGDVESGRPMDRPGAHARGYNERSIGICLVGGTKKDGKTVENNFTPAQFHALAILLRQLTELYPNAEVLGHRNLPGVNKGCPSFDVRKFWKPYLENKDETDSCLP